MTSTQTTSQTQTAADYQIGDYVWVPVPALGRSFDGTVCGVFPPEDEVEVMVWIPQTYTCWDGSHVPACSGTVQHTHAGYHERISAPASQIRYAVVEAY